MEEDRLNNLLKLLEERIEVQYGFVPEFKLDDASEVDFYIQEIRDSLEDLIDSKAIAEDFHIDDDIFEALDDI